MLMFQISLTGPLRPHKCFISCFLATLKPAETDGNTTLKIVSANVLAGSCVFARPLGAVFLAPLIQYSLSFQLCFSWGGEISGSSAECTPPSSPANCFRLFNAAGNCWWKQSLCSSRKNRDDEIKGGKWKLIHLCWSRTNSSWPTGYMKIFINSSSSMQICSM